jgi:hypothetical protein
MDAKSQHERFRKLYRSVVQQRLRWSTDSAAWDWAAACYFSFAAFVRQFPDRAACEAVLEELDARSWQTREQLATEIERVRTEGLTYLDVEGLRYDLPARGGEDESLQGQP